MIVETDSLKPIYYQIADWLKDQILAEKFMPDEKIYSQYQLADMFNINPATAAKGINILAEEEILYKKRGLGMYVSKKGKEIIMEKRKNVVLVNLVKNLLSESKSLGINSNDLIKMIKKIEIEMND